MLTEQKQKQLIRAEIGRRLSGTLRDIIRIEKPHDSTELLILSERIMLCNSDSNIWIAKDFVNLETGESFDASGRFWNCNSKLCPYCTRRASLRNRRNLTDAIEQQKLFVGENYKMLTLTMPRTNLGMLDVRRIMNLAWSLFRKRKWFKSTIIGGSKSEEFTVNAKGFHYHIHLFVRAKYISYHKFRAEWSECLFTAFERAQKSVSFPTADGLAIANVLPVTSIKSAIFEVCKYITKSDSFEKLQSKDLLDIARIKRFPRMFELFGSFKILVCAVDSEIANCSDESQQQDYLDKKNLSDGTFNSVTESGWRSKLSRIGATKYLAELREEINDAHHFRRNQLTFHRKCSHFWRLSSDFRYDYDRILVLIKQNVQRCAKCKFAHDHSDVPDTLNAKALVLQRHISFENSQA